MRNSRRCLAASAAGFSMFELMVVLVITGLLLGAVLTPLATRVQIQQIRDQLRALDEIRDVLLGFAQTQGYLPCADTDGDGLENSPCPDPPGAIQAVVGQLPYATLGVPATDRWGRRYVYAASPALTQRPILTGQPAPNAGVDLSDSGVIVLQERLDDKTLQVVTNSAAAILVSLGGNGFGGFDVNGNALATPTGGDEVENTDNDEIFITRSRTEGGGGCSETAVGVPLCEFDDLITVIPTPLVLGRLVQAGRLP